MKRWYISYFYALLLMIIAAESVSAQERAELEQERKKITNEIATTTKQLENTRADKKSILYEVALLQQEISQREELLETLDKELLAMDKEIVTIEWSIIATVEQLKRLKFNYQKVIQVAYRYKTENRRFIFLLSAKNFKDALQRWQYLRRYDAYRKRQAKTINEASLALTEKKTFLQAQRIEKKRLMQEASSQNVTLAANRLEKLKAATQLNEDEAQLLDELQDMKHERRQLTNSIDIAIRNDMEAQKDQLRNRTLPVPTAAAPSVEIKKTTFASQRGKLPMPTENGRVVANFGKKAHPTFKQLTIQNNGIDIATDGAQDIKVVSDGEVKQTFFVKGSNHCVVVSHGAYYTVYSNLVGLMVRQSDKVSAGDAIGRNAVNAVTGRYEVHFEVWKGRERQNPSVWLAK